MEKGLSFKEKDIILIKKEQQKHVKDLKCHKECAET